MRPSCHWPWRRAVFLPVCFRCSECTMLCRQDPRVQSGAAGPTRHSNMRPILTAG